MYCQRIMTRDIRTCPMLLLCTVNNFCFVDPVRIIPPENGKTFSVPHKQSFSIKCKATGVPPPEVYWTRLDPFSFQPLPQRTPPEILHFPSVQDGQFLCFAENTVIHRDYSRTKYAADMTISIVVTW